MTLYLLSLITVLLHTTSGHNHAISSKECEDYENYLSKMRELPLYTAILGNTDKILKNLKDFEPEIEIIYLDKNIIQIKERNNENVESNDSDSENKERLQRYNDDYENDKNKNEYNETDQNENVYDETEVKNNAYKYVEHNNEVSENEEMYMSDTNIDWYRRDTKPKANLTKHQFQINAIMDFLQTHLTSTNYFYSEMKRILKQQVVRDELKIMIERLQAQVPYACQARQQKEIKRVIRCFKRFGPMNKKCTMLEFWNHLTNNLVIHHIKDLPNDGIYYYSRGLNS